MKPTDVYGRKDEIQIIDVREPEEWAAGRIAEARHIPMQEVPNRLAEIARDRTVAVVCRSGNRSGQVARYLQRLGYAAENMEGGVKDWVRAGLPFSTPGGGPGRVV